MTHIHFMGIGGVGMAGLAFLLKRRGYTVTGCDKYASPRTRWLEEAGIPVFEGHAPAHLAACDTLIVTPAVKKDHPELLAARTRGLTVRTRGEVLAACVNETDGIAVCGTHGKTTTATFTTRILALLGGAPAWCIGGETGDMPVAGVSAQGGRAARDTPFVAEADESDGTLALYRARTLVITSLDYDHPEHFKTPADYRACFAQAESQAQDVIRAWELNPDDWPELNALVIGRHNLSNARAAIEVALRRGYSREAIAAILPQALADLPDRRFQIIWPKTRPAQAARVLENGLLVVTDYAHHPAELSCALAMAAALRPRRLRVLFQPHRYTRTAALKEQFPPAFAAAHEVVLIPVYTAFEAPVPGGDIADLYAAFRRFQMQAKGTPPWPEGLRLATSAEEAWRHAFLTRQPGDLVLLAGAGDIIGLVPRLTEDLTAAHGVPQEAAPWRDLAACTFFKTGGRAYAGGPRRIVGQGSNSWFSDCATALTLREAPRDLEEDIPARGLTFPAGMIGARLLDDGSPLRDALAFMAGIPGTLGGWVRMNAGAFGHALAEAIESVTVEDDNGVCRILPAAACGFAYRQSAIEGMIVAVTFRENLPPAPLAPAAYRARRKAFPPRTCGSVFKNPALGNPAGVLLEEAGAKDLRVGGAFVWREHANVIVAGEGATASDILALSRLMAAGVRRKFGIALEPEIRGLPGCPSQNLTGRHPT